MTKIREAGGTVTYMRFPDEGHGIAKQANRVAYFRKMASFLEQHLQPNEEDTTD